MGPGACRSRRMDVGCGEAVGWEREGLETTGWGGVEGLE